MDLDTSPDRRQLLLGLLMVSGWLMVVMTGSPQPAPAVEAGTGCSTPQQLVVRGDSMAPLINDSQTVTVQRGYYDCHQVQPGDVVTINWSGSDAPLLKQVRAVPGDGLGLDGCHLVRDGQTLRTVTGEPYCFHRGEIDMLGLYTGEHIDGYLVLGQQPGGSTDSSEFGLVGKDMIAGHVSHGTSAQEG